MVGLRQDRLLNGNDSTLKHNKQRSSSKGDSTLALSNSWKIANETEKSSVHEIDLTKTPIQVKILYETNVNKQCTSASAQRRIESAGSTLNNCDINENCTPNDSLIKGQTLLTSFFRPIDGNSKKILSGVGNDGAKNSACDDDDDDDDEYDNPLEIDYAPTCESIASDCEKTDRKCLLLHRKRIRRKYNRISTVRQRAVELLVYLAKTIRKQFTTNWHRYRNKHVLFVYQCMSFYHRFSQEFVKQSKSSEATLKAKTTTLKMTTEAITINRRVQKLLNDHNGGKETSDEAVVTTVTTPNHGGDGSAKRPPKSQRSSDNSRLLLLTENAHESSEKDFGK